MSTYIDVLNKKLALGMPGQYMLLNLRKTRTAPSIRHVMMMGWFTRNDPDVCVSR